MCHNIMAYYTIYLRLSLQNYKASSASNTSNH
jgi:hypothetical protein